MNVKKAKVIYHKGKTENKNSVCPSPYMLQNVQRKYEKSKNEITISKLMMLFLSLNQFKIVENSQPAEYRRNIKISFFFLQMLTHS